MHKSYNKDPVFRRMFGVFEPAFWKWQIIITQQHHVQSTYMYHRILVNTNPERIYLKEFFLLGYEANIYE